MKKRTAIIISGLVFLVITSFLLVMAQSSIYDIVPPDDLICNQNIKGEIQCMQNLDVIFNEKYKAYYLTFKEVSDVIIDTNTKIVYSPKWSLEHNNIYKSLKVVENDLLNEEYKDLIDPSIDDCLENPKLPKCIP